MLHALFFIATVGGFGIFQAVHAVTPLEPIGLQGRVLTDTDHWLALVGDSGITGAASATDINATVENLWGHVSQIHRPIAELRQMPKVVDPLTRVLYSKNEFLNAGWWLGPWLLNVGAKLALTLDTHEHSFGYRVGRALGVRSEDIVLVGQDGVRIDTIAQQLERVFEMQTSTLPPLILLSYTANDMCDVRVLTDPLDVWVERFRGALEKTWLDAEPFLRAHARGTKIMVLSPLNLDNVILNTSILKQKILVEGQGQITCEEVRTATPQFSPGPWLILRILNLMCPSVTSTIRDQGDRVQRLQDLQRGFIAAWRQEIKSLNSKYKDRGIEWVFLDEVFNLQFTTGDVGHDCFHPSAAGHAKIADLILRKLKMPPPGETSRNDH